MYIKEILYQNIQEILLRIAIFFIMFSKYFEIFICVL